MKKWQVLILMVAVIGLFTVPGIIVQGPCLAAGTGSWQLSQGSGNGFGLGSASSAAVPLVEFKDRLYAGVMNQSGAQVWELNAYSWKRVVGQGSAGTPTGPGFGDPNNMAVLRMHVYGNYLYAGTVNIGGCQVWRTSNGSSWQKWVGPGSSPGAGFGNSNNLAVTAMEVFSNKLYVGLTNFVIGFPPGSDGAEIWSYDEATVKWTKVAQGGFGDKLNAGVTSLCGYKGYLYVGTVRFHISIASVSPLKVKLVSDGCELRRKSSSAWNKVRGGGFTDPLNMAAMSMDVYGDKLYVGTLNGSATATLDSSFNITELSFNSNGLYVYSYDVSGLKTQVKNGFGSKNDIAATSMETIDVGGEDVLMVGAASLSGAGKLEAYNGTQWYRAADPGFGNTKNTVVSSIAQFDGAAYVGTANTENGCRVYYGTPPAAPPPGPEPAPPQPKPEPKTSPASTWYLAEGSSDWGFFTYITIENPNSEGVNAEITYMTGTGPESGGTITLPPASQATLNPADSIGVADFSTEVVCKEGKPIAVDRTMIWTGQGAASPEAHSSVGVTSPQKVWYLPEGSADWGFECWLLIQNPNDREASCDVTYMIEGAPPKTVNHPVPPNSRQTFSMATDIGAEDASIKVEANVPVIPERAMYRNSRREGHDSIGTASPANDFYLAEGTTDWGFTTYVLVQNPNPTETGVIVTYMTEAGPVPHPGNPIAMPANSRKTIRVNDVLPGEDFSTQVHSDNPIIAERAMYWGEGGALGEACHDSIGMSSPHATFYLPDGQTSDGRETWTLVQNPNSSDVSVEISYLTPTGEGNVVFEDTVPANSRKTYNMAEKGISGRAAVMVTSKSAGKNIMVERAMYWNSRGAGTDTIGGYAD